MFFKWFRRWKREAETTEGRIPYYHKLSRMHPLPYTTPKVVKKFDVEAEVRNTISREALNAKINAVIDTGKQDLRRQFIQHYSTIKALQSRAKTECHVLESEIQQLEKTIQRRKTFLKEIEED